MKLLDDLRGALARSVEAAPADPLAGGPPAAPRRVGGRLQREKLERVAPALPSMPPAAEPSGDDFRRKVEAMTFGEPEALGALPSAALPFDLDGVDEETGPLRFGPRDVLRAVLLGEVLAEPKGRRAVKTGARGR